MDEYIQLLTKNFLFKNIDPQQIKEAIQLLSGNIVNYSAKTTIASCKDPANLIGIILKGQVHINHIDDQGNNCILKILEANDLMYEAHAVSNYPLIANYYAQTSTTILYLSISQLLRKNILTNPLEIRLLQNLTLILSRTAYQYSKKLLDNIHKSTRSKLQDYLSSQYYQNDSLNFNINLNRQELADYLFVDRSAMSKELSKMQDEGIIKYKKGHFELAKEMNLTEEIDDPENDDITSK